MTFITFRRHYIDKMLDETLFSGRVLDIGGQKNNKRGLFRPPINKVGGWEYVNINKSTEPDYHCSAEDIPVDNESFDMILMTEVLEHLENPRAALQESSRILKPDGKIIATIPFLFPIHADPHDYQRWTQERLKIEFKKAGYKDVEIKSMGSVAAVFYDILYASMGIASKSRDSFLNRLIRKILLPPLRWLCFILEKRYAYKANKITTGFYISAYKYK